MFVKSLRGLLEDVEGIADTGLVELTDGSVVEYLSCDIASFSRKRCGDHSGIYVIYDTEQGKFLIGRVNALYMNVKTKLGTLRRRTNGNDEAYAWYSQYATKGLRVLWIYIADSDLRKREHEGVLQHDKLAARV